MQFVESIFLYRSSIDFVVKSDSSTPSFYNVSHMYADNNISIHQADPVIILDNSFLQSSSLSNSQSAVIAPTHIYPTRPSRTKQLPARFRDFTGLPSSNVVTSSLCSSSTPTSGMSSTTTTVYPLQHHITYQNSHRSIGHI